MVCCCRIDKNLYFYISYFVGSRGPILDISLKVMTSVMLLNMRFGTTIDEIDNYGVNHLCVLGSTNYGVDKRPDMFANFSNIYDSISVIYSGYPLDISFFQKLFQLSYSLFPDNFNKAFDLYNKAYHA